MNKWKTKEIKKTKIKNEKNENSALYKIQKKIHMRYYY